VGTWQRFSRKLTASRRNNAAVRRRGALASGIAAEIRVGDGILVKLHLGQGELLIWIKTISF
jgi:hypothetical protein